MFCCAGSRSEIAKGNVESSGCAMKVWLSTRNVHLFDRSASGGRRADEKVPVSRPKNKLGVPKACHFEAEACTAATQACTVVRPDPKKYCGYIWRVCPGTSSNILIRDFPCGRPQDKGSARNRAFMSRMCTKSSASEESDLF